MTRSAHAFGRYAALFVATLLAATFAGRSARAAGPSARLTYVRSSDAASCPDEAALRRAVGARFGYDPFFPWATKSIVVTIGRESGRLTARVQLVDENGIVRGTRELRSDDDDCSQIFDATALAISIVLDAFANAPAPPPPPPAAAPATAPAPEEPPPAPTPVEPPPAAPTTRTRSPFLVGVDVLGSVESAPGPSAGLGVFVSVRRGPASMELRAHGDVSAPVTTFPVGRVETAHVVATLAPCLHHGIVFACAIGELGWLRAWSSDVDIPGWGAMPFFAAGARAGFELPLSAELVLRVYAEGAIDLDRARYEVDYHDVWTASVAQGTLGIGLGRRIP